MNVQAREKFNMLRLLNGVLIQVHDLQMPKLTKKFDLHLQNIYNPQTNTLSQFTNIKLKRISKLIQMPTQHKPIKQIKDQMRRNECIKSQEFHTISNRYTY